jgi:pyruvate, water dikinase
LSRAPERLAVPLDAAEAIDVERVGGKAATLARLVQAGLPVPNGICLTADAYRLQLEAAGVSRVAEKFATADNEYEGRRHALEVRLGFLRAPLVESVAGAVDAAYADLTEAGRGLAVRSSALREDAPGASFAGQFDTFLGNAGQTDLVTAVRACWACLWSTRALRYMQAHQVDPARTAMAVLIQRMVEARAAGGALSRPAEGGIVVTGTWGLGSALAQGEVVPDRWELAPDGSLESATSGRKDRQVVAIDAGGARPRAVAPELVHALCLSPDEAGKLAQLVAQIESILGSPVEVEWAKDEAGFQILQARPLHVEPPPAPDALWLRHPGIRGQPAGVGWATGPACIVLHEHDLEHVKLGDVLVTQVAGPALTAVLPRVVGVVAELGGSTSHLAALARERGIPAVLGVPDATRRIPSGSVVAVDGVAGIVRWAH